MKRNGTALFPTISTFIIFESESVRSLSYLQLFATSCHGLEPARLLHPWDFPGKNIGVGCHFLLEGIFLNQGSKVHLLLWQVDSLSLGHLVSQKY